VNWSISWFLPACRNAQRQLEALGYDVIITLREDAA
jgi:hypothetical protein